jgi:hypothetical protein
MTSKQKPKTYRQQGGSYDNCQTPTYATVALLEEMLQSFSIGEDWTVFEVAAGEGYMARDIALFGYSTKAFDIELYGERHYPVRQRDFLLSSRADYGDPESAIIVTNPPYSGKLKKLFLRKCLSLGFPFALLMPYEFGGTGSYYYTLKHYGIKYCKEIRFPQRPAFKMPGLGWTGSENRDKMLAYWRAARHKQFSQDIQLQKKYSDPDKLEKWLNVTATAQFPVMWYTHGFEASDHIKYYDLSEKRRVTSERVIEVY